MRDCLQDQKEVESQLKIADILLSQKTIEESKRSLKDFEKGIDDTVVAKQSMITEMRKIEGDLRKMQNQEETIVK